MKTTKLLLAGLISGTMALGVACSTDKAARNTEPVPTESTGMGTGGAGPDVYAPTRGDDMTPIPEQDATREMEPDVHQTPMGEPPGTGGAGLDEPQPMTPEPIDRPDGLGQHDGLDADQQPMQSVPNPSNEGLIQDGQR